REVRAMTILTLFPDDQADAEWTTRDPADIAAWLRRIGVGYERVRQAPDGFSEAARGLEVEHVHDRPQCYLFDGGIGALYLRAEGRVHLVICEPGDLVIVPEGLRHWIDLGEGGAARLMVPGGGAGDALVTDRWIAGRFPSLEAYRPALIR